MLNEDRLGFQSGQARCSILQFLPAAAITILVFFPDILLAQQTQGTTFGSSNMGGGIVLAILIGALTRKRAIGGWLLLYFLGVYGGILYSILLVLFDPSPYGPAYWPSVSEYIFFLIATIPQFLCLVAETILSFKLIPMRSRQWKYILLLRRILAIWLGLVIISLVINLVYLAETFAIDLYKVIMASISLAYFYRSKRVRSVYLDKNWGQEVEKRGPDDGESVFCTKCYEMVRVSKVSPKCPLCGTSLALASSGTPEATVSPTLPASDKQNSVPADIETVKAREMMAQAETVPETTVPSLLVSEGDVATPPVPEARAKAEEQAEPKVNVAPHPNLPEKDQGNWVSRMSPHIIYAAVALFLGVAAIGTYAYFRYEEIQTRKQGATSKQPSEGYWEVIVDGPAFKVYYQKASAAHIKEDTVRVNLRVVFSKERETNCSTEIWDQCRSDLENTSNIYMLSICDINCPRRKFTVQSTRAFNKHNVQVASNIYPRNEYEKLPFPFFSTFDMLHREVCETGWSWKNLFGK